MKSSILSLIVIAFLLNSAASVLAQNPAPGLPVNSPQISMPLGSINALTGGIHFEIPIASIPQRGDDPMIVKLVFDNGYLHYGGLYWTGGPGLGVVFGAARAGTITSTTTNGPCPDSAYPNGGTYTTSNYAFSDSNGTSHNFPSQLLVYHVVCTDNSGNPDPNTGSPTGFATSDIDGLGYNLLVSNWTDADVGDIDGYLVASTHSFNFPEDLNGNYFSAVGPIKDMLGRQTITFPGDAYTLGCTPPHNVINVKGSDGNTNTWTAYCQTYNIAEVGFGSTTMTKISKIVLPDLSSYQFNYDSGTSGNHLGGLTSVTLPTGGQETFTYSCTATLFGSPCDLASATFGGGTRTFTFVKDTHGNYIGPTTVMGPLRYDSVSHQNVNDKTVYGYSFPNGDLQNPAIGSIKQYNGSTTLLKTVAWTYKSNSPSRLIDTITTTLNDAGQSSKVQYQYLSAGLQARPTQIQEWDFGSSTPMRTTKYAYTAGYRISSESVWAGDGTTGSSISQTTYSYDEYSTNYCKNGVPMLSNVTGAVGHDDVNYGAGYTVRLNLTSISRWVSGSKWLTSHRCYDTLGNVTQVVDENGNPTTFDYSDTGKWVDTSCISSGTNTHAFPTTVTDAAGNRRKATYYSCTDLAHTVADENDILASRAGTTYTYDGFGRPLSTTDELGVTTNNSYTANTSESVLLFNGGASSVDELTTVDGFGRTILSQRRQAPGSSSFDTVQTTYDAASRESTVSAPCSANAGVGCPPSPVTTTNYDALGRTALITDGGGGTTSYSYTGNDVLFTLGPAPTGEHTKQRQLEYDAFGRLTSVCELTTLTGSGPCGQHTAATGFKSTMGYDTLGNLLQTNQSGQLRSYTYDGLNRKLTQTLPESGLTQLWYDTAPATPGAACAGTYNSDLVKIYDANGNTTCNAYDKLHRALSASSSGPNAGPNKYFVYEGATVNGTAMQNTKGRMAEAYTATTPAGTKITDLGFSYTARGETADTYESTPHSTVYYHNAATYWENGELKTLDPHGAIPVLNFGVDPEGRRNRVANTGPFIYNVVFNPASQITSMSVGVSGSTPAAPSWAYDNGTGKVKTFDAGLNGNTYSNALTWNQNGSLQKLMVTDTANASDNQTCTYSHDDLQRIGSVNCGAIWTQSFSYDPLGNISSSGNWSWNPGYSSTTNRYSLGTTSYDANGDLLNDSFHIYTWFADGHVASIYINAPPAHTYTYIYDALGRSVELQDNGTPVNETNYFDSLRFTMSGANLAVAELPLIDGVKAVYNSGGSLSVFRLEDWLGSPRLNISYTGGGFSKSHAYSPFGMVYASSGGYGYNFTDQPSFSDGSQNGFLEYNFPARQLHPIQGRWLSPDPAGEDGSELENPQSWNAYAYAWNNPLTQTDPTGERPCAPEDSACVVATPPPDVDTTSSIVLQLQVQDLNTLLGSLRNSLQNATQAVHTFMTAPRDPGCMANAVVKGGEIGTGAGIVIGGLGLGTLGTAGGPAGTLLGGGIGIAKGGALGGLTGGTAGWVVGFAKCSTGGGGSGANTPVGRRGNPMKVARGTNQTEVINGRAFSGHALDEMQAEGIPSSAVENTIQNGAAGPGNLPGTATHTLDGLKVVTNSSGKVVTVTSVR